MKFGSSAWWVSAGSYKNVSFPETRLHLVDAIRLSKYMMLRITTNKSELDVSLIHEFLSKHSSWA